MSVIQKKKHIADDICFIARSCGMHSTVKAVEKSYTYNGVKNTGIYYSVYIGRNIEMIPTRVARKKALMGERQQRNDLNFLIDVSPLGIDDYYGFELDGNHLYLLGDFTVTHNTGKDFLAAEAILHFLMCFPESRVCCTANSADQLQKVLWSQISRCMTASFEIDNPRKGEKGQNATVAVLNHLIEAQAEKIYLKGLHGSLTGQTNFVEGITSKQGGTDEEVAKAFAGRHAPFMLWVIDEASGIPQAVYDAIERTQTGRINVILMIFNPRRAIGFAVDSQYKDSERWVALRWSAEDSELVPRSLIEAQEAKYGRDSNTFRISILGLPPLSDDNTLIPWDWIEDAMAREVEPDEKFPLIKGVDVGGGGDKSVICSRRAGKVYPFRSNTCKDTMELTGWVNMDVQGDEAAVVNIDTTGLGQGVYDRLRETLNKPQINTIKFNERAQEEERFANRRAEMYWRVREAFERREIDIPDDNEELRNQLGAIRTKFDSRGRIIIEKKDIIKKAIGHSPDDADALALTYAWPDLMFAKDMVDDYDEEEEFYQKHKQAGRRSYMGA